ncbi:MAG: cupin domain-containing protein, partial [Pseudomonadota bacterium]
MSDILTRLSVEGVIYFRTSFSAPFGVRVPEFRDVVRFHFAHRGGCDVVVEGRAEPVRLAEGDLLIVPHGARHALLSPETPADAALDLDRVVEEAGFAGQGVLVHGGGAAAEIEGGTELICGHFSFAPGGRHVVLERLPPALHIPGYDQAVG